MSTKLIKQRQVEYLLNDWLISALTILAAVIVVMTYLQESTNQQKVFLWSSFTFSLVVFRTIFGICFDRTNFTILNYEQWLRIHSVLLVLSGIAWGSMAFLLEPSMSNGQLVCAWMIISLIITGSSVAYSVILSQFYLILLPTLILVGVSIFYSEVSEHAQIVAIVYAFAFFITLTAIKSSRERLETIKNFIEIESLNTNLKELATRDPLTNLVNRRGFEYYFEKEWERLKRSAGVISLLIIDLDYFKKYNDHYGHDAGDKVLIRFANTLNKALHRPADMAVRFGGEEFLVLLPDTTIQGSIEVAERIRKELAKLNIENIAAGDKTLVTASMGIASTDPTEEKNNKDLFLEADRQLYLAKDHGRDTICFKDEKTNTDSNIHIQATH